MRNAVKAQIFQLKVVNGDMTSDLNATSDIAIDTVQGQMGAK